MGRGHGPSPVSSRRVASARPPAGGTARSFGHGLQVGLRARELCRAILDGFKRHDLLTYSSAISFQIITAVVPFLMFVLALAGLRHALGSREGAKPHDTKALDEQAAIETALEV